MQLEAISARLL